MKTRTFAVIGVFAATLLIVAGPAHGDKVMINVLDWNQPDTWGAPPNIGDYPLWCSPTAGADLMGYWEDHYGCVGLTDRQVGPASPAYPNNGGTYKQGLSHDGTIELGWWMDTGLWRSTPLATPPKVGSTGLNNIGPGLVQYAADAFIDPGSGIKKVAFTAIPSKDVAPSNLAMWTKYIGEINANRPVLVSFGSWVNALTQQGPFVVDGQNVYTYAWDPAYTHDHTVCGVGYSDATPGVLDGNEMFIVQDDWATTMQYVMVPLDAHWGQNDYLTIIPEPATLTLAALGLGAVLLRRRRR